MKTIKLLSLLFTMFTYNIVAQVDNFGYTVELVPISVTNLPGLHSYAYAQHEGKWLLVGGRLDGLHARQPFNAFPASQNNTNIIVVDVAENQFYTASVNSLATPIKEQLQSTNMNFYQDADTLYFIGGYGFSATANTHVTYDKVTSLQVSALINAVIQAEPIAPHIKQLQHLNFRVNGGQLGKIGDTFYLVGGHSFMGTYNPNNNPTFTQEYTNQIRKFKLNNSAAVLTFSDYETVTDIVHLHRRDYNLVPQVFPNGLLGYTISSGVFQINADLPFLYPVDINENGYFPQTDFNQYLSNYHGAKVGLYSENENNMHSLFFGGMSQYYYQNGSLIQDNLVPFVSTISRVTRYADSTLQEFRLPIEMPSLKGASAEFIVNSNLPMYSNKVIKLDEIEADEFIVGHIFGGIKSTSRNPFANNQTATQTSADNNIYAIKLIKNNNLSVQQINGVNPNKVRVYPNPTVDKVTVEYFLAQMAKTVDYFITNSMGKLLEKGTFSGLNQGENKALLDLAQYGSPLLNLTLVIDNKFYLTQKIAVNVQ